MRRCRARRWPSDGNRNTASRPGVDRRRARQGALPEARLGEHEAQCHLGVCEGAIEAVEEPVQPIGNVQVALLGRLEDRVVVCPRMPDLCRHAVETLRAMLGAGECKIRDCARD